MPESDDAVRLIGSLPVLAPDRTPFDVTVLVTLWPNGESHIAWRTSPWDAWSPPVELADAP